MLVNTAHPYLDTLKGSLVGDVECNDHAVSLSIELVSDCFKSLLTSRVPNLDVKLLIALLVLSLDKVHAYCTNVLAGELGIAVLLDD
jgi:hypothetical protein